MSSRKATLTKATDQYHIQKSLKEYGLMITGQETNFSYGVNMHKDKGPKA